MTRRLLLLASLILLFSVSAEANSFVTPYLAPRLDMAAGQVYPQPPNVGLAANLPTFCSATGQTYYATDTSVLYYSTVASTSCTWAEISGGGGGGLSGQTTGCLPQAASTTTSTSSSSVCDNGTTVSTTEPLVTPQLGDSSHFVNAFLSSMTWSGAQIRLESDTSAACTLDAGFTGGICVDGPNGLPQIYNRMQAHGAIR